MTDTVKQEIRERIKAATNFDIGEFEPQFLFADAKGGFLVTDNMVPEPFQARCFHVLWSATAFKSPMTDAQRTVMIMLSKRAGTFWYLN